MQTIEDLARYFKRPPDQLEPEHIRQYQAYLFRDRKLSPNTVNQRTGALRFFFITVLRKSWSIADTPYPKRALPATEDPQPANRWPSSSTSATTPFYRILLMTLYATGLRRAELARLKVTDIDSERMVIHVQGGKGHKDREVMLSPKLLDELAAVLAQPQTEAENVAVPRQPLAYGRASHGHKSGLAGLSGSSRTRRAWHRSSSAHLAPLLRHSSAGGWRGPANHSAPARAIAIWKRPRSICTFPTCICSETASPLDGFRSKPEATTTSGAVSRWHGHRWRWPISSAPQGGASSIDNRSWLNRLHLKVLTAIERCRTAALGGHLDRVHALRVSCHLVQLVP